MVIATCRSLDDTKCIDGIWLIAVALMAVVVGTNNNWLKKGKYLEIWSIWIFWMVLQKYKPFKKCIYSIYYTTRSIFRFKGLQINFNWRIFPHFRSMHTRTSVKICERKKNLRSTFSVFLLLMFWDMTSDLTYIHYEIANKRIQ